MAKDKDLFSVKPKIRPGAWRKLRRATTDYRAGKNISPAFSSVKKAIDYLDS